VLAASAILAAGLALADAAAAFPDRPIELTVPFGAGGGSDLMARTIAAVVEREKLLPEPLVVVNRPGANGVLGYLHVGLRPGNPHLLTVATSSIVVQPLLGRMSLTHRDYTPIAGLALDDFVLVVRADSPHRTVRDVVDASLGASRGVAMGGSNVPSADSIIAHLIQRATGARLTYVPFNSGGEVMANLLGGHVQLAAANPGEALEHLRAGRLRVLAVASDRRLGSLPDVPTLRESGVEATVTQWRGVLGPKGLPPEAEAVLVAAFRRLSESAAWAAYLQANGLTPHYLAPEAVSRHLAAETERMAGVLRDMGVLR
jgi:putative tricarboxylic transport membrane protein